MRSAHVPVLLEEVLRVLDPRRGQTLVDCTVGLGGHAEGILRQIAPNGFLLGLDLDPRNLLEADRRLKELGGRHLLLRANFAGLPKILAEAGVDRVDGIFADLGVAGSQIDDPARGFSYLRDGPLDMRMDPTRGATASEILNRIDESELREALRELGDETDAPIIARLLIRRRPVRTTGELAAIVCEARDFTLERARGAKLHPAARTFQALRILVNRELANLDRLLAILPGCLRPGSIAAIVSFHSGEDRRVKKAFQNRELYSEAGPWIEPTEEEVRRNPRARSAKLRWARTAAS